MGSLKMAFSRRQEYVPPKQWGPRLAAWLALLLAWLALFYPSVVSDITDTVLGPASVFAGVRWSLAVLCVYVLIYRKMHWWEPVALLFCMVGLIGGYSQNLITHHPLKVDDLFLCLAFTFFIVRLLFRPTPYEDRRNLTQMRRDMDALRTENLSLRASNEELVGRVSELGGQHVDNYT